MRTVLALIGLFGVAIHLAGAIGLGHAVTMWKAEPITCTVGQSQESGK